VRHLEPFHRQWFDSETVNRLDKAAERLSFPKSRVIREAVEEYYERIGS
jgi:predicted DNA-binding protein